MTKRNFLMLQGPIGPFFKQLAERLTERGNSVTKVNFWGGDETYFPTGIRFRGTISDWPNFVLRTCHSKDITDIVLFGDRRSYHEVAIEILSEANPEMRIWVFEEGYFRPNWITLDQYGVNARSALPRTGRSLEQTINDLDELTTPGSETIKPWVREFMPTAVRYYGYGYLRSDDFGPYKYHRLENPAVEALGWVSSAIKRLIGLNDVSEMERFRTRTADSHFVCALQLEGDFQIRKYSPYKSNQELIESVLKSFTKSGGDRFLVIKVHPYDYKWDKWRAIAHKKAEELGIADRVAVLHKSGASELLDDCSGFVTVNSTYALTALEKGVPVKALGNAFWNFSPITNSVDLDRFWHNPVQPKMSLFSAFKQLVMSETQINGGFYSKQGRDLCLETVASVLSTKEQDTELLSREPLQRLRETRKNKLTKVQSLMPPPKKLDILA